MVTYTPFDMLTTFLVYNFSIALMLGITAIVIWRIKK